MLSGPPHQATNQPCKLFARWANPMVQFNNNRRPKADMDAAGNWLRSVTDLLSKNSFKALSFYLTLVPLYRAFT